jgi:hypothetical protein
MEKASSQMRQTSTSRSVPDTFDALEGAHGWVHWGSTWWSGMVSSSMLLGLLWGRERRQEQQQQEGHKVTLKHRLSPRNNQAMLCFPDFQNKFTREVEKKGAALSGCHRIRALSLFFSLL